MKEIKLADYSEFHKALEERGERYTKMKEIKALLGYIKHLSDDDLTKIERILRLVYMSQQEELAGASQTIQFDFSNCRVSVRYGKD